MLSRDHSVTVDPVALETSISKATEALLGYRQSDGHWVFELEADSTIPAEYVLLRHYLAEPVDAGLEAKIANYLRRAQGAHGGLGADINSGKLLWNVNARVLWLQRSSGENVFGVQAGVSIMPQP